MKVIVIVLAVLALVSCAGPIVLEDLVVKKLVPGEIEQTEKAAGKQESEKQEPEKGAVKPVAVNPEKAAVNPELVKPESEKQAGESEPEKQSVNPEKQESEKQAEPEPEKPKYSTLRQAAIEGNPEDIKHFIDAGADVNHVPRFIGTFRPKGTSILEAAIWRNGNSASIITLMAIIL